MNQYSTILKQIYDTASSHKLVNTVTKGTVDKIDIEKQNIFPLVHISLGETGKLGEPTVTFNVSIEVVAQRDMNKEINTDKFWRQDNEVDNHNETFSILLYIWLKLKRDWDGTDITASDSPPFSKIDFEMGNVLDGFAVDFEIEIPNTTMCLWD